MDVKKRVFGVYLTFLFFKFIPPVPFKTLKLSQKETRMVSP